MECSQENQYDGAGEGPSPILANRFRENGDDFVKLVIMYFQPNRLFHHPPASKDYVPSDFGAHDFTIMAPMNLLKVKVVFTTVATAQLSS